MQRKIYFGGSRNLGQLPIVGQVVRSVISSGSAVHVGCQFGADQAVINSVCGCGGHSFLFVFAVAGNLQAPSHVRLAYSHGASVKFSAGGGSSVPIKARYLRRSIAAFQGCSAAVFFQPGSGSLAVARECVGSGLPVFAFQEQAPAPIPSCAGQWVQSSFHGFACWSWQSAQLSLF